MEEAAARKRARDLIMLPFVELFYNPLILCGLKYQVCL
jgi:hypothetical protein